MALSKANAARLRAEITGDPLARGYSGMSDQAAADSLNNLIDRDGPAAPGALFNYLARNKAKDVAAEPAATHIIGRLRRVVADGKIGAKTFVADAGASVLTGAGKDACETLLQIALSDRLGSFTESLVASEFKSLLQTVVDAGVMKPADRAAIMALSQNQQSRAGELTLPPIKVGWLTDAKV